MTTSPGIATDGEDDEVEDENEDDEEDDRAGKKPARTDAAHGGIRLRRKYPTEQNATAQPQVLRRREDMQSMRVDP